MAAPFSRKLENIGGSGGATGAAPLRESLDRGLETIGKASEGSQAAGSVPLNWKQVGAPAATGCAPPACAPSRAYQLTRGVSALLLYGVCHIR
jgi:hypothetical protein|eukprot:COSAG06_NODE_2317_length_7093_cov_3.472262_2_plen_93_part_00